MNTIEGLPILLLADWVPGRKQGEWTYRSLGRYSGKQTLPSQVVPGMTTPVEDFFASVW